MDDKIQSVISKSNPTRRGAGINDIGGSGDFAGPNNPAKHLSQTQLDIFRNLFNDDLESKHLSHEDEDEELWTRHQSQKVSVARQVVGTMNISHTLTLADPTASFDFKSRTTEFASTFISDFAYSCSTTIRATLSDKDRNCYLLVIPVTGHGHAEFKGKHIEMAPGDAVMFSPEGGLAFEDSPPYWRNLLLKLDRKKFENYIARHSNAALPSRIEFDYRPISLAREAGSLLSFLQYLLQESRFQKPIFSNSAISANLEEALFGIILDAMPNNANSTDNIQQEPIAKLVKYAEAYIRENYSEELDIAAISKAAHTKSRSLHNAFRKWRGYTPLQYLQACRLNKAHHALRASHPNETTVTQVAFDAGFSHLSKFAAAYRRRFDEAPSTTLKITHNTAPLWDDFAEKD